MPAVLSIPFVAFFGPDFPQQILAHLLGAGSIALAYILAKNITGSRQKATFVSLALGAGSVVWFLSTVGSVWYLGQVSALFFVLASMYFIFKSKPNIFFASLLFTMATLSRTQIFLAAPFVLLLVYYLSSLSPTKRNDRTKKVLSFAFSVLGAASLVALYNFTRFGNPFETGYKFIPGLLDEPWFAKGVFHPSYIPNHLRIIFTSLPFIRAEFPYVLPTWWGLAIWFTSPVFLFGLLAPIKNYLVKLCWGAIFAIALVNFSFGSTGFTMFGYRYAVDFYPFIILLLCFYFKARPLTRLHWILLVLSILVNVWGVVFIRLGWVV